MKKYRLLSDNQHQRPPNHGDVKESGKGGSSATNEQLHKEISWCVEQLRMGIYCLKPTTKQAKESERVLKILTSTKAPLVKKRQVMHQTFGDYRKKILAEDTKWEKDTAQLMKYICIRTVPSQNKGKFFKYGTALSCLSKGSFSALQEDKNDFHKCTLQDTDKLNHKCAVDRYALLKSLENDFCFCFHLDESS